MTRASRSGRFFSGLYPGDAARSSSMWARAAALLSAGDVDVLDVDAVCLLHPADDIPVSGLAGDHALMVAVVIQERQDAERPVIQRDNGISEAKVRTPA